MYFYSMLCPTCNRVYYKPTKRIQENLKRHRTSFCSRMCKDNHQVTSKILRCTQCGVSLKRKAGEVAKSKSGNFFCGVSCSAVYNNLHKKHGKTRSKYELHLEEIVRTQYPTLDYSANDKRLGAEIDFLFPGLKLAVEVNGVYHRLPIHGQNKLRRIQELDKKRKDLCQAHGLSLHIIEVTDIRRDKESVTQQFIDLLEKYGG